MHSITIVADSQFEIVIFLYTKANHSFYIVYLSLKNIPKRRLTIIHIKTILKALSKYTERRVMNYDQKNS